MCIRDRLKASHKALKLIYKPKFRYHKAGVILSQLIVKTDNKMIGIKEEKQFSIQTDLFSSTFINKKKQYRRAKFIDVIDEINSKLGKGSVIYGAQGIQKKLKKTMDLKSDWQMKSYYCSPAYTTRWDELLKVS